MAVVTTIAGSDSSGGAGIQADLKTFRALGVYATTVVTAVTAQDTSRVHDIVVLPEASVAAQFDAVVADTPPDAIKIGMLGSPRNVELVADRLRNLGNVPVVLDPVLASTSGTSLIDAEALGALERDLVPLASVVTPNLAEAGRLVGFDVRTVPEMEAAARRLHEMGAGSVVVTGGHLTGRQVVDVFFDGEAVVHLARDRIPKAPRGTGCVLSAAIAAHLAGGLGVLEAVEQGVSFAAEAIRAAWSPGKSPVCDP